MFEYLARFSNATEWDPGVIEAEDTTPGPRSQGSSYRLVITLLGRRVPLDYRIAEIDPPQRVVLHAQNALIRSTDVIEVASAPDGGSAVTYTATLILKGVRCRSPRFWEPASNGSVTAPPEAFATHWRLDHHGHSEADEPSNASRMVEFADRTPSILGRVLTEGVTTASH